MSAGSPIERLKKFFASENRRLAAFVRGLIDDASDRDAEDIVQDVALHIFELGDISEPIEHIGAYVYQALRNRVVDAFRRRRPDRSLDETIDEGEDLRLADVIADSAAGAREDEERGDLYRRALSLIRELPQRDQALIIATEIEGWTFAELSRRWDAPIGTLLSRKSRALGRIREALQPLVATN